MLHALSLGILLSAPAAAQGPLPALAAAAPPGEASALVGACAPLDAAVALLNSLPEELWELTPLPETWLDPQRMAGLAGQGLDPGGAFTVAGAPGQLSFGLPVTGKNIDEQAILTALLRPGWTAGEGRSLALEAEDSRWQAWPQDGRLLVVRTAERGSDKTVDSTDLAGLAQGFDNHPGCVLAAADLAAATGAARSLPVTAVAVQVPFDDHPLAVRARTDRSFGRTLSQPAAAPVMGSGDEPMIVFAVNVRPIDALLTLIAGTPLAERGAAKQLQELEAERRRLDVGPGLTLALYQPGTQRWTAVLPMVKGTKGRPAAIRRIRKALEAVGSGDEFTVVFTEGDRFEVAGRDRTLHGRMSRGMVVVGTQARDVDRAIRGEGAPWLPAELTAEVGRWPIAVATPAPRQLVPGAPPFQAFAALSAEDQLLEVAMSIRAPGMLSGPMTAGVIAGIAVPNFAEMQRRARVTEVARVTEALHERALAAGAGAVSLPPTPRPPEGLSVRPVPWPATTVPWLEGFSPQGNVRGSYRVDFDAEGGFVIEVVMDADGDGKPSRWRLERQGRLERLTGPEVW